MVNKTKNKLAYSLEKLLLNKKIDKITIDELTKDANVNRQTFYYHFKDIYNLIEWIYINEIINELKVIEVFDNWEKSADLILNYILKNKNFIIKTYELSYLETFIYNQFYDQINRAVKKHYQSETDFITRFYTHAFIGILKDWIKSGMKESPKSLIKSMKELMGGPYIRELDSFK